MQLLRKLFRRPRGERRLLLQVFMLVIGMRLGLDWLPFRHVRALVTFAGRPSRPPGSGPSIERVAAAVTIVSRYVPRATCLTQALAAELLLRRAGYPVYLRLGAARGPDERFEAHAWVECDGRVVIGGAIERYSPFPRLDGEAS